VIFLDEPTASLDPGATQQIENIIAAMHATRIVSLLYHAETAAGRHSSGRSRNHGMRICTAL